MKKNKNINNMTTISCGQAEREFLSLLAKERGCAQREILALIIQNYRDTVKCEEAKFKEQSYQNDAEIQAIKNKIIEIESRQILLVNMLTGLKREVLVPTLNGIINSQELLRAIEEILNKIG